MPLQKPLQKNAEDNSPEKEIEEDAPPALLIAFVGPDTSPEYQAIAADWRKTNLPHIILENGNTGVSSEAISTSLEHSVETTHIHYLGHGHAENQCSFIDISGISEKTATLLERDKDRPGIRHFWGCYIGAGSKAVEILGEDRPVIWHSGKEETTLKVMNSEGIAAHGQFYHYATETWSQAPEAWDAFEHNLLTFPQTTIFSVLHNGKVETFTARGPAQPCDNESLEKYLRFQLQNFRDFRKNVLGHDERMFHDMEAFMIPEIRQRYLEYAMMMEMRPENYAQSLEKVFRYLQRGVNPNFSLHNGITPLYLACQNCEASLVRLLLQKGSDVYQCIHDGSAPLLIAGLTRNEENVDALLEYIHSPKYLQETAKILRERGFDGISDKIEAKIQALEPKRNQKTTEDSSWIKKIADEREQETKDMRKG